MSKRDAQTFEWNSHFGSNGEYLRLEIIGRKETTHAGKRLMFAITDYPQAIAQRIRAAGHKAVFQQRTSQCETDAERFQYWRDLHDLFRSGTWEREGGERGAPVVGAWIEVLADKKSVTVGQMQTHLTTLSKEARDAIRAQVEEKYAKEIAAWKAERKEVEIALDVI